MRRFFAFLRLCAKEAFPDNVGAANDWQWVVANPWWQSIGAAVCAPLGGFFANYWRGAPMISPDTAIGTFIGGLVGFALTWLIAYFLRFLKAPSVLYYREKDRADKLEENTRPKILVLGTREHLELDTRIFDLEIKNCSDDEITNCIAKVTAMKLFKLNIDGTLIDYSAPYQEYLPIALKSERNGGNKFGLLPRETKRIRICSRQDGIGSDLHINFETGSHNVFLFLTWVSKCDLDVEIYGASNPPKENLCLTVENERLKMTRGRS
jgi:hypothetical protein